MIFTPAMVRCSAICWHVLKSIILWTKFSCKTYFTLFFSSSFFCSDLLRIDCDFLFYWKQSIANPKIWHLDHSNWQLYYFIHRLNHFPLWINFTTLSDQTWTTKLQNSCHSLCNKSKALSDVQYMFGGTLVSLINICFLFNFITFLFYLGHQ